MPPSVLGTESDRMPTMNNSLVEAAELAQCDPEIEVSITVAGTGLNCRFELLYRSSIILLPDQRYTEPEMRKRRLGIQCQYSLIATDGFREPRRFQICITEVAVVGGDPA